jgi:anti-sigma factor RsiW
MKCREAIRLMTYGRDAEAAVRSAIQEHAATCLKCRSEFATHSLFKSLLKEFPDAQIEQQVWEETRLINQVRARIRANRENGQLTWESAIISIRGWLFAFAAAAIFLLALSGQLAFKQNQSGAAVPQNEDLISNNTQLNSPRDFSNDGADNAR